MAQITRVFLRTSATEYYSHLKFVILVLGPAVEGSVKLELAHVIDLVEAEHGLGHRLAVELLPGLGDRLHRTDLTGNTENFLDSFLSSSYQRRYHKL